MRITIDAETANMHPNVGCGPYVLYSDETKMGLIVRATQPPAVNNPIHVPCIQSIWNLIISLTHLTSVIGYLYSLIVC